MPRSRFFSLVLGLLFVGMAVGPTLGSLVIRSTGRLISIFYVSTGIHFLYALFVWFILPESLSLSYRLRAREKYAQRLRTDVSEDTGSLGIRTLNAVKKLFGFLAPLNVFFPEVREMNNNPLKKKRNWNLTLVGLAYFMVTSLMVRDFVFCSGTTSMTLIYVSGHLYVCVPICRFNFRVDLGNCEFLFRSPRQLLNGNKARILVEFG